MEKTVNSALFDFIAACPSALHTADTLAKRLAAEGYTELFESEQWRLSPAGRYFTRRGGSALIAFRAPVGGLESYMIMAAHGDSPAFKVKESAETVNDGYRRVCVEKYGGMLCSTWLDRPLSVAGRVLLRRGAGLESRLVNIDRDLMLIPNVAIHMDRSANDGKKYDANVDMLPLLGQAAGDAGLDRLIADELGVSVEDIVSRELAVYCRSAGRVWGADGEFISAPRLDDLQCVFGCMEGFLKAKESASAPVLCVFDNEEVGSGTKQGADSDFLSAVLRRVWAGLGLDENAYLPALANSFMVSADNAHAVHPNHPEYADRNDRPKMNGGIVIKYNANQKYTTDALSAAVFAEICRRAGVQTQRFTNRADLAGGSTLGNISSAHVSIDTVDIGLAQLAMHSAYETAGARDTAALIRAAEVFFGSALRRRGDKVEII